MGLQVLNCPSCGGKIEFDKDQEFGFCKYCGAKIQNTSIKKIRGSVKIDKNTELENYKIIARRALSDNDNDTAVKYYDLILGIEPNNWEAIFYKAYCGAMGCRIMDIRNSIVKFNNCLGSVVRLLKENEKESDVEVKIAEIMTKTMEIILILVNSYQKHYDNIGSSIRNNYNQEYIDTQLAGRNALETLFDLLIKYFPDVKFVKEEAVALLESANVLHIRCYSFFANKPVNLQAIHDRTNRIKQYNSNYEEPKIGGCYIATCVYGSYNCSQVWVLRRYRDNKLANSWHGRLFIKIYYSISPTLVRLFGNKKWFKNLFKKRLDRMVEKLKKEGYEDTPYNDI